MTTDVVEANEGLGLIEHMDAAWENVSALVPTFTDPMVDETMQTIATGYEAWFGDYRQRTVQVESIDPWSIGLLLCWMEEEVGWLETRITRFKLFQQREYWDTLSFTEWANQMTSRAYSTWRQWMRGASTLLRSSVGLAYLRQAGIEPEDVPEMVNMDKAVRAAKKLATGELEEHQLATLVNPAVTVTQHRHALNTTFVEWEEEQALFVAQGSRKEDVVYEDGQLVVYYDAALINGSTERVRRVICSFEDEGDPVVSEKQQVIVKALGASVKGEIKR